MTSSKENLIRAVEKSGWYFTTESLDEFLAEKPNLSANELIKKALNSDLRNVGAKCLPEGSLTGKLDKFEANHVLQIVKIRNIAAPKENENSQTAPPLYKITLTDGTSNVNALTLEDVSKLNTHTPPGSKVYLHGLIKIKSSLLILNSKVCEVLGGNVEHLIHKWKQSKELQELQHMRGMNLTHSAPPPWVPFGHRQVIQVDTTKKVFAQNEKPEEDGSSEFSQARQAALAEAMEAKSKVTKTFTQQTVEKVQIPELANEVRPTSSSSSTYYGASAKPSNSAQPKGKRGKGRKNLDFDNEDDYKEAKDAPKPSAVTLFDLFKTKLDIKDDDKEVDSKPVNVDTPTDNYRGNRQNKFSRNNNQRDGNAPQTFRQRQQQQQYGQKNETNKQTFNLNDFNYELGDTTNVKKIQPTVTSAPPQSSKPTTQSNAKVSQQKAQKDNQTNNEETFLQQKIQPAQNQQSFQSSNDRQTRNDRNNYKQGQNENQRQTQKTFNQNNNQGQFQNQRQYNQNDFQPTYSNQNMQGPPRQNHQPQQQYYSNDRFNSNQQAQQPYYQNDRYNQNQNQHQQQFYNQNDMYNQNQQQFYANNNGQSQYYQNDGYNFNSNQQQPYYQNNFNQNPTRQKGNRYRNE